MNLAGWTDHLKREWSDFVANAIRPRTESVEAQREGELIQRASGSLAARAFLESEEVRDFMAKAEAQLTHELLALPLDDNDGRRALAVAINTQRALWKYLAAKAQDGISAERELARLKDGPRGYF